MVDKIELKMIPVDKISPSPFQPRETFEKESIRGLADSIKRFGILQPIIIKPTGNGNYQIIAGERRWRAYQFAKLKEIPAIIKDVGEKQQMAESLIENIHREDLSPLERGKAAYQLFHLYGIEMPPKELADKLWHLDHVDRGNVKLHADRAKQLELIKEVCEDIGKSKRQIITWLETISISEDIQKLEIAKPKEKQTSSWTLARLSTIEEELLQKEVYEQIAKKEMGGEKASKFITHIKKAPEPVREAVLKPQSKITPEVLEKIVEVEDKKTQEKLVKKIEKETLSEEAVEKIVSVVREAPEPIREAVLKPGSNITPEMAVTISKIKNEDAQKIVIHEIETEGLSEYDTKLIVEQVLAPKPGLSDEEWGDLRDRYQSLQEEFRLLLSKPEVKKRGGLFRNWLAHNNLRQAVEPATCPICGASKDNLIWKCHNINIDQAAEKATAIYQQTLKKGDVIKKRGK